jgi:hypothetical protein
METIKFLALAADGICVALIIGVGFYRLALWIKRKKANKVTKAKSYKITQLPIVQNYNGDTILVFDERSRKHISIDKLKRKVK